MPAPPRSLPLALPALILLCCLAACPGVGGDRKEGRAVRAASAASLVHAAGDGAPLVLVLRQGRYQESAAARAALAAILAGETLPAEAREPVLNMLKAPTPWAAVRTAAQAIRGNQGGSWPATLLGLDEKRPLVAAIFEPTLHDMSGVGAAATSGAESPPPMLRHRLLVPATDVPVLVQGLRALCAELGLPAVGGAGAPEGTFGNAGLAIAVFPGKDHVRVEVVESRVDAARDRARIDRDDEDLPQQLRKPGDGSQKQTERPPPPVPVPPTSAMLAVLASPPWAGRGPLPRTPSLRQVVGGDDLVVLHLRPWLLRDLSLTLNAAHLSAGIRGVDPSMYWTFLSKGWAEIAAGYLLISPEGAQIEDMAFGLSPDLHLSAVFTLTRQGAAAWGAARSGALAPLAPQQTAPPLFSVRMGLDTKALLTSVVPSTLPDPRMRERVDMVHECGPVCILYAGLCAPLNWGNDILNDKRLARNLPSGLRQLLPGALSISVTQLHKERGDKGEPGLTGAMAVGYPKKGPSTTLLDLVGPLLRSLNVQTETRSVGGQELLSISARTPAAQILAPSPSPLPSGVLMEWAVDLARLRLTESLSDGDRSALSAGTKGLSGLRGRLQVAGGALVTEVALDLEGAAPRPFASPAADAPTRWGSPWAEAGNGPGGRCLAQAVGSMCLALNAVAGVDPSMKLVLVGKGLEDAEAPLSCAERDPATREEAKRLRQSLATIQRGIRDTKWD